MTEKKATAPEQQTLDIPDESGRPVPIAPLHNLACQFAELSSQAGTIRKKLGDLKEKMAELMEQHELEDYDAGGVSITFTEPALTVKVAPETRPLGDTDAGDEQPPEATTPPVDPEVVH